MNRKQMVVLWAGIAAFVLIGLFPPMTGTTRGSLRGEWWGDCGRVDVNRMLRYWAIVTVVAGGLIYTLRGEEGVRRWVGKFKAWAVDPGPDCYKRRQEPEIQQVPAQAQETQPAEKPRRILRVILAVAAIGASAVFLVVVLPLNTTRMSVWDRAEAELNAMEGKTAAHGTTKRPIRLSDIPSDGIITPEQARAELQRRAALTELQRRGVITPDPRQTSVWEGVPANSGLRFDAIHKDNNGRFYALIGDGFVHEGETVKGYRVRKVRADSVEFEKDGEIRVQKID